MLILHFKEIENAMTIDTHTYWERKRYNAEFLTTKTLFFLYHLYSLTSSTHWSYKVQSVDDVNGLESNYLLSGIAPFNGFPSFPSYALILCFSFSTITSSFGDWIIICVSQFSGNLKILH